MDGHDTPFSLRDANEHGIMTIMNITSIVITTLTVHMSILLSIASGMITRMKHDNNNISN